MIYFELNLYRSKSEMSHAHASTLSHSNLLQSLFVIDIKETYFKI